MHEFSPIMMITTTPDKETAGRIADSLVRQKLAACVQVSSPILSVYTWQGKIEKEKEYYCVIKTSRKMFKKIETIIKSNHPYEVPEIIAVPLTLLSQDYQDWMQQSIQAQN